MLSWYSSYNLTIFGWSSFLRIFTSANIYSSSSFIILSFLIYFIARVMSQYNFNEYLSAYESLILLDRMPLLIYKWYTLSKHLVYLVLVANRPLLKLHKDFRAYCEFICLSLGGLRLCSSYRLLGWLLLSWLWFGRARTHKFNIYLIDCIRLKQSILIIFI